jgi:hypothetical protein
VSGTLKFPTLPVRISGAPFGNIEDGGISPLALSALNVIDAPLALAQ